MSTAVQRIGYVRVSTTDQNAERPVLVAALRFVRYGDTLVLHSMDRLAHNVDDLRRIVKVLTGGGTLRVGGLEVEHQGGVRAEFVKEALIFAGEDSPMSNLLLTMLGAVAEFERSLILERQREGVAIAKAAGKYHGTPFKLTVSRPAQPVPAATWGSALRLWLRSWGCRNRHCSFTSTTPEGGVRCKLSPRLDSRCVPVLAAELVDRSHQFSAQRVHGLTGIAV